MKDLLVKPEKSKDHVRAGFRIEIRSLDGLRRI